MIRGLLEPRAGRGHPLSYVRRTPVLRVTRGTLPGGPVLPAQPHDTDATEQHTLHEQPVRGGEQAEHQQARRRNRAAPGPSSGGGSTGCRPAWGRGRRPGAGPRRRGLARSEPVGAVRSRSASPCPLCAPESGRCLPASRPPQPVDHLGRHDTTSGSRPGRTGMGRLRAGRPPRCGGGTAASAARPARRRSAPATRARRRPRRRGSRPRRRPAGRSPSRGWRSPSSCPRP